MQLEAQRFLQMLCPPTQHTACHGYVVPASTFAHAHHCFARGSDLETPRRNLSADLIGGHRGGSDLEDTTQKDCRLAGAALVPT